MIGRSILLACICLINAGTSSSFGQSISLDHVVLAVSDLDSATAHYSRLGFKIKPGMLHANGLKNAHIKFSNGTEMELMTVVGTPKDALAKTYQRLIDNRVSGAYVALTGLPLETITQKLEAHGIVHEISKHRQWNYITFPENSPLAPIFFIEYKQDMQAPQVYYQHTNRAYAIDQIQISNTQEIQNLFKLLAIPSRPSATKGLPVYLTPTGNLAMFPSTSPERPDIKSVQFLHKENWDIVKITFPK